MDKPSKTLAVLRSLESFQALRSALAYLRSMSVLFEGGRTGRHLAAIEEEIKAAAHEQLTGAELSQNALYCSIAAMCTHISLVYTAVCFYGVLVETNSDLRHERLDQELEKARRNGLLESMRQVRNAVFHIRPNTRSDQLVLNVVKRSTEQELQWDKLENLLFDATEKVFCSPETLFREKKEVLEEGFRNALAYYEEHLAERQE